MSPSPDPSPLRLLLGVQQHERRRLALAACFFFCVLASYYLLRPLRDAMGVTGGVDNLPWLFLGTLGATVLVSPLFAWLVSRWSRREFVGVSYRLLIVYLGLFYLAWTLSGESWRLWIGRAFFVWLSVYVLFAVSLMWSVMADSFPDREARRLFPLIGAGGTLGGIAGSALAGVLTESHGMGIPMLLAALFLEAAVRAMQALTLRSAAESPEQARIDRQAVGGQVREVLTGLLRSPYLLGVAGFILLYTIGSTFLYLLQAGIVAAMASDIQARGTLFARIDLFVNIATLASQLLLTRHLIARMGVPMTLALLPLLSLLGFAALAIWPAYALLIFVQAGRRAINFAIASPTRELLYVPLPRGEKFKVKNFIDTFVFRAGDQIGALTQAGLNTVGAGIAATALLGLPLCAGWLALAFWLGRRHRQLTLDPIAPTPDVSATVPPSASGEAHATGSS